MAEQDIEISELVAKIERGDLRLPEMQRQYVWQKTRVRDLLDSLYRGYPSGTILTWEPAKQESTREFAIEQDNRTSSFQLLLDGQQRLTSLSALLRGKPVSVRGVRRPIDILFNLEHPENLAVVTDVTETNSPDEELSPDDYTDASEADRLKTINKMAFIAESRQIASLPHWVSVSQVFRDANDRTFLQKAGVKSMEDPRYDKYSQRLQKLRAIKMYKYRVNVLDRNKSYEEVTEIFVRVNSLGAKLRSSDLALAQITAKWRDSLKLFQDYEGKCKKSGFELELGVFLKGIMAIATGQSRFHTLNGLSKRKLEESWELAKRGMDFAIDLLRSNIGIDSEVLLASPSLLIALAFYGHKVDYDISPAEAAHLRYWILVANAKGRYTRGSSETLLDQDLSSINKDASVLHLLQLLRGQVGAFHIEPTDLENRNRRSAYFKTMFLAFHDSKATDWRDQLIISLKHTSKGHALQTHHIFPQSLLKERGLPTAKINDICNLAFISGRTNRRISNNEPSQYLPDIVNNLGPEALSTQCIPLEPELWRNEQYDEFLKRRRVLVAKRLNEYIDHESAPMKAVA